MLMRWWRETHIGIKVLLILCLVGGIGYSLLDSLLGYTDDAEIVRHGAAKAAWVTCATNLASTHPGMDNDQIRPVCECASQRFAKGLTAAQIKPFQKHKDPIGPAFALSPAFEPQLDAAVASCSAAPAAR